MTPVPQLRTARFTLRGLERGDAAALLPTLSDPTQCLYLLRPAFASEEELWSWLAAPDWPGLTWIAVDAEGAVAARLVAYPAGPAGEYEIGYITCAEWQRQGVASEAMAAVIAHLFAAGVPALTAEVDADNAASIAVLGKLGFVRTRFAAAHDTTHKGVCDVAWYRRESPLFPPPGAG